MAGRLQPNDISIARLRCRTAVWQVFVISAAANLLLLTVPLYMLQLFDRVLTARSVETLILLTCIAVSGLVVFGLLHYLRARIFLVVGDWLEETLGPKALARAVAAGCLQPDLAPAYLRHLQTWRGFVAGPLAPNLFDIPWVPVFLAVIYLLSPLLGLLATAGALVLLVLAWLSDWLIRRPDQQGRSAQADMTVSAFETVTEAETVTAMRMQADRIRHWRQLRALTLPGLGLADARSAAVHAVSKSCRQILQIGLLGVGAYLFLVDNLPPGVMIAASIIAGRALAPIEQLIATWRSVVQVRNAYHWLQQEFDRADLADNPTVSLPAPVGDLRVEYLSYHYPGSQDSRQAAMPALKNISFHVPAGEVLAIVGPSGAGKSTLARLLVGIHPPGSGFVRLDGGDITTWRREDIAAHIGYVPQQVTLFRGTIAENISRFRVAPDAEIIQAAQSAGVHQLIVQLADGYNTHIDVGGSGLSGGERQAVGLARAFFGQPRFVVMDEPLANLDRETEDAFCRAIAAQQGRTTIVAVTHQDHFVKAANRVLILEAGARVACATPQELFRDQPRPQTLRQAG